MFFSQSIRMNHCHTLILDLKILLQNSFLFLILFNSQCFTLQFSTVLQLHILPFLSLNFLAFRAIQSAFLALQVIWKFLNQLYIFLHSIPNFCIKIIQSIFRSFPAVEPILVLTFVSESFQLVFTKALILHHWSFARFDNCPMKTQFQIHSNREGTMSADRKSVV